MKKNIDSQLLSYIEAYLNNRPSFYSFIRTQELYYFNKYTKYISSNSLDFGCGDGFFASLVSTQDQIDVGLDLEDSRIYNTEYPNSYHKKITYDGKKIPFKSNHFNSTISNCVLEHLPNLDVNLSEIHRTLKPDGYFITTVMTDKWENFLSGRRIGSSPYLTFMRNIQDHHNLYSYKQWKIAFKQAGFKQVLVKGYLNSTTVKYNELSHFLSLPQLISYKLTGRWVPIKNWYKHLSLSEKTANIILKDLNTPVNDSAALFFILKK